MIRNGNFNCTDMAERLNREVMSRTIYIKE